MKRCVQSCIGIVGSCVFASVSALALSVRVRAQWLRSRYWCFEFELRNKECSDCFQAVLPGGYFIWFDDVCHGEFPGMEFRGSAFVRGVATVPCGCVIVRS